MWSVDMGLLSRNGGLLATPKSGDSSRAEPHGVREPVDLAHARVRLLVPVRELAGGALHDEQPLRLVEARRCLGAAASTGASRTRIKIICHQ